MLQQFRFDVSRLHRFLATYIDHIPITQEAQIAGPLEVTLYVALDTRIKAMLTATKAYGNQQNKQIEWSSPRNSKWFLPKGDLQEAMRNRDPMRSSPQIVYTPIVSQDPASSRAIGLLRIRLPYSSPRANFLHHPFQVLAGEQSDFEAFQAQLELERQHEVLHTLHEMSVFDPVDLTSAATYKELLAAALNLAPEACLGHLITVVSDSSDDPSVSNSAGDTRQLRIEYALPSKNNPPQARPSVVGAYNATSPERHYPVTDGVTGECVRKGRNKYCRSVVGLKNYKKLYKFTKSEACFLLSIGNRIIGLLNLESESEDAFTVNEIHHLEILSKSVALIVAATTGDLALNALYAKGLLTFDQVLDAVVMPEKLIEAMLDWSREISSPPFEYAEFVPSDDFAALNCPPSGDESLRADGRATAAILPLQHDDTYFGTLTVCSAGGQTAARERASQILGDFVPVLGSLIHASMNISNVAWLAGALAHTRQSLHTAIGVLDEHGAEALASDQSLRHVYLSGMLRLIDAFCEIASSAVPTDEEQFFKVTEAMNTIEEAMAWRFRASNITFSVAPSATQALIRGDQTKLHWALIELLANALKFSKEQGGREVKVKIHPSPASKRVEIWVEDQCEVIPLSEREDIWKPGYQGQAAKSSRVSGRGVGLHTVHTCVVTYLHGSRGVQESSTLGGNKFILGFPCIF